MKITDFGTSTIEDDQSGSPRNSFVGTQDYVSPEVLSGEKVATKACDLWALGCMVYQMLSGISPFRGGTEYLTFENIMGHCKGTQPLTFPPVIDETAQDLILKLLKVNDAERLGAGDESSMNGYGALKAHPFFEPIAWGELEHKQAPFTPDPSRFPSDTHMRDGSSEEWLMEGEPTPIMSSRHSDYACAVAVDMDAVDVAAPSNNAKWEIFLKAPERRVFTGLIFKRKVSQKYSVLFSLATFKDTLLTCLRLVLFICVQGLFSKKRQLILTDHPRLLYVDPDKMEYKGEIPWTAEHPVKCHVVSACMCACVRADFTACFLFGVIFVRACYNYGFDLRLQKNAREFDVECSVTGRAYHISDPGGGASMWADLINAVLMEKRHLSSVRPTSLASIAR